MHFFLFLCQVCILECILEDQENLLYERKLRVKIEAVYGRGNTLCTLWGTQNKHSMRKTTMRLRCKRLVDEVIENSEREAKGYYKRPQDRIN